MKLSKTYINFLILVVIFIAISTILIKKEANKKEISKVCFKENCFSVELAKTNEEKQKGLMSREYLDKDKGMLFIYQIPSKQPFWMKNTLIPLDIIWINKDYKVVHIATAQPCKKDQCEIYSPEEEASYILEINTNLSEELNINEGEIVKINLK